MPATRGFRSRGARDLHVRRASTTLAWVDRCSTTKPENSKYLIGAVYHGPPQLPTWLRTMYVPSPSFLSPTTGRSSWTVWYKAPTVRHVKWFSIRADVNPRCLTSVVIKMMGNGFLAHSS
jgi:hypothetical protein